MLNKKTYTRQELIHHFKTDRIDSIKSKLTRQGYTYTTSGRGQTFELTISGLPPRFKTFCIEKLNFAPQTDFERLKVFFYHFFLDDDFRKLPFVTMKEYMIGNVEVTYQTISRWIKKLYRLDLIADGEDIYYCIDVINKTYRIIKEEEYKNAWRIYWENRIDEDDCPLQYSIAYNEMCEYLGGHPYKKQDIIFNAIYNDTIDELVEILKEETIINETGRKE